MGDESGDAAARAAVFDTIFARLAARRPTTPEAEAEARAAEEARWQARARKLLDERAERRGVPESPRIRRWIYPETVEGDAFARVDGALAQRGGPKGGELAMVLLGASGCGKSSALARGVARHDWRAIYILAPFAADALSGRPRCFSRERDLSEIAEALYQADLVAIDELGTEPEDAAQLLENLASARTDAGHATLFAGNLTTEAFVARYRDGRFHARLRASWGFVRPQAVNYRGTL